MATDPRTDDTALAGLTRSQFLIWTGQRLQPDEPLYNMALSFRIRGELDIEIFRAAFAALVDRCDALRTTFVEDRGAPRQRFHKDLGYRVEFIDLCTETDPEAALEAWQQEHATRCFDTTRLLFECSLLRLGSRDYVWFFNQHHLTTDAWSTALIYRNMQAFYALARGGRLAEAPQLPQYRDYLAHEESKRQSRAAGKAKAYWQKQLRNPLAPSTFYRATPADRSGQTTRIACRMGKARSARVKSLASRDGFRAISDDLARFQVFATTLLAWLYRISGHRTLAIGTPSHSRSSARHKQTIGLFIEIFPLLTTIDKGECFATLYAKVALATRDMLINAPAGASGFAQNRAYDVLLNYITAAFGDFDGRPMTSQWLHADHGDRNHLLRLQVEQFDRADEFRLFFDLNVDTFVGAERQRAGRHYLRLLDAFIEDPDQAIDDIDLADADESAQLLALSGLNEGVTDERTVIQLFDEQAGKTPNAVAVVCNDCSLTYRELLSKIDTLAAGLVARGATPGARIAIALPRSIEAVAAMLAVMKCGAAYVPVDTAYPIERIGYILRDAKAFIVLTLTALLDRLPDGVDTLCLDAAPDNRHARITPPTPADDAYVIYTSGSTGRPKGVVAGHRGLANYLCWARDYYLDGRPLAWAMFSSLSFDLTVTSVFVPLISGGRIVIYPQSSDRREIAIRRVVDDNAVDIVKLTPAHLALIQPMDLSVSKLRTLIVGGEDLKTDLARSISQYFGDAIDIYNEYGPTEGTVACTVHRFDPDRDKGASVPIGTPIRNAFVYVLDDRHRLQPRGVVGELYIGGAGVARGYLNRDDLTADRFLDNPFRPGEKMYRSGDLARWNDDGTLACLGRSDLQIKIHGVRVEPGEIEAALLEHTGISETVVQVVERGPTMADDGQYCLRCGITGRHPKARLDTEQVCRICRVYEDEREQAMAYFGDLDDLRGIVAQIQSGAGGEPDCIMLLSGGKDSTYALCQLVDLGLTPLVLTLDNGFISEGAKANIRRVVDQLGLELVIAETPAMNAIFADSLKRFSNVCNGCFKTIYTLSVNLARERGIRYICTGLSRGQIFETRVADLFHQRVFDPVTIDATIIEARKAYHRADDAVSRALDVSAFREDAVFEEIRYLDFYRYADVSLDEILDYLASRVSWVRPADTGRSTNCLINEAGIYVHKKERGYHNYALPYSWDVRLGHKQRDAAREELDDDINIDNVQRILGEIGYEVDERATAGRRFLTGYYVSAAPLEARELQARLGARLPAEFIPTHFVHMTALPLTVNGKVDRAALPDPDTARPQLAQTYAAPQGRVETALADIWADVLGIDRVGVHDNFFDLGGDSILNIQIVTRARKFGLSLTPQQIFDYPTIAEAARVAGNTAEVVAEQGVLSGEVGLTPIQQRFFALELPEPDHYNQAVLLELSARPDVLVLQEALRQILSQHDALRSRFEKKADGWQQRIMSPDDVSVEIERLDLSALSAGEQSRAVDAHAARMHDGLDLANGRLVRAALFDRGPQHPPWLLMVVHHLVIDGVSWWILLDDLEHACTQMATGMPVRLSAKTTSVKRWAEVLRQYAASPAATDTGVFWQQANPHATPLPIDLDDRGANDGASAATVSVSLGRGETGALLTEVASGWRTQAPDLIVTAVVRTLTRWMQADALQIDFEGHGREDIATGVDLLRTVGWFTTIYPLTMTADPGADPGAAVRRTRDRLREVPARGIGFGALRDLSIERSLREQMAAIAQPEVLFNYLGQWDRAGAQESSARLVRPVMASFGQRGPRAYLLEINAVVFEGRLRIDWGYSRNRHRRATITRLAGDFRTELSALIAHCRATPDNALTPQDFPDAGLSQGELDDLLAEFGDED